MVSLVEDFDCRSVLSIANISHFLPILLFSQTTFSYDSKYWTNCSIYQPEAGVDLEPIETKLPSYCLTPLTKLCVGMKIDQEFHSIFLEYNATSLFDVIHDDQHRPTNIALSTWRSLLPESSLQVESMAACSQLISQLVSQLIVGCQCNRCI